MEDDTEDSGEPVFLVLFLRNTSHCHNLLRSARGSRAREPLRTAQGRGREGDKPTTRLWLPSTEDIAQEVRQGDSRQEVFSRQRQEMRI